MAVFTRKHVSVKFVDGTGTPLEKTIGPGPGDFTFDGIEEGGTEAVPVYSRGDFLELVYGDEKQITGSGTIYVDGDQTGSSVIDAALKTGGTWASGVTKDPGGVVWTTDIVVTETRGATTNTYTFSNCRTVVKWTEGKEGNTLSFSFTCYNGFTRA